jgi:hypothetical protein
LADASLASSSPTGKINLVVYLFFFRRLHCHSISAAYNAAIEKQMAAIAMFFRQTARAPTPSERRSTTRLGMRMAM